MVKKEYHILTAAHGLRKHSALCLYCDKETEKFRDREDAVASVRLHISVIHDRREQ